MNVHVSNVCRLSATDAAKVCGLELHAGMNELPISLLHPRQVLVTEPSKTNIIRCELKFHRGTLVPVLERGVAEELVRDGVAKWCPQKALVYTITDYINDPDVLKNREELAKAEAAQKTGVNLVLVAIVGDNRSPLSVCRNIVSGCQKMENLKKDAEGAMDASNIFLVE